MEHIIFAFGVVFPLFVMMATGVLVRRWNWIDDHSLNKMNSLVFKVFLPMLVFLNIYNSDMSKIFNAETAKLIAIAWICVAVTVFLPIILLKKKVPEIKRRHILVQGIYRGNLVLFGIPVAEALGGTSAVSKSAVLISTVVPLFNLIAVVLLERARSGNADLKKVGIKIATNPLIIASLSGLIIGVSGFRFPEMLVAPFTTMSKIATPMAFVILGGTLKFDQFSGNMKALLGATMGKLVLMPALAFAMTLSLGFSGDEMIAMVGAMASPTAVSSFTMAKDMDVEGDLAAQIVAMTSVMSIITIFLWVLLLKSQGLI